MDAQEDRVGGGDGDGGDGGGRSGRGGGGGGGDGRDGAHGDEGLVGLIGSTHGLGDGSVTGADGTFDRTERGTSEQQEKNETSTTPTEMPSPTKHVSADRKNGRQPLESSPPTETRAPDTAALKSSATARATLAPTLEVNELEDDLELDPTVHLAGYESSESLNALSLERSAIKQRETNDDKKETSDDEKETSDDETEASGDEKNTSHAGAFRYLSPQGSLPSQTRHEGIRRAEDKLTLAGTAAPANSSGKSDGERGNCGDGDEGRSGAVDSVPSLGAFADLSPRGPFIYGYHHPQYQSDPGDADRSPVGCGGSDDPHLDCSREADDQSFDDASMADSESTVEYYCGASVGEYGELRYGPAAEDEAPPPTSPAPAAAASPARPLFRGRSGPDDEIEEDCQMNDYDRGDEDDDKDYSLEEVVFRPRGASRGPPSGVPLPANVSADTETTPSGE